MVIFSFQKYRQRNENYHQLLQIKEYLTFSNAMLTVYHTDINLVRQHSKLNELLRELPEMMHERAKRYKFEKDAYNFVVGRLLLKKGLAGFEIDAKLEDLQYSENGKPFLEHVSFNISHTEDMVVCAFSTTGEIGIDIERVKEVNLADFEPWFTNTEWTVINTSSSPIQKFYWYWTRKESIIKALGISLSELHRIEIENTKDHFTESGKKWFLKDLDIGTGFCAALCTDFKISEIRRNHIEFKYK